MSLKWQQCAADPDAVFRLTEEGKAVVEILKENPELTFDEACIIANKVKKESEE